MSNNSQTPWPELPTAAWRDTCATVQLWTQVVGKIRLTKSPWLNHSWHVTLYVTPRETRNRLRHHQRRAIACSGRRAS